MSWSKTFKVSPHSDWTLTEQIERALYIPNPEIANATTQQVFAVRHAALFLARELNVPRGHEISITASGHSQAAAPGSMPDSMSVSVRVTSG